MDLPKYCELIDFDEYNMARKVYLTSSALFRFQKSPVLFKMDLDEGGQEATASMDLGTAAHKLILEGESAFLNMYGVGGPINEKTGKCFGRDTKKFGEWVAESGFSDCVTAEEFGAIKQMRANLIAHEIAGPILAAGFPEITVRKEFCGVRCQVRIDWLNPDGQINDLKTCADIDRFQWSIRDHGYIPRAAFYRDVVRSASGEFVGPAYRLVVVETRRPYRVGVWEIVDELLDEASENNKISVEELIECQRTGFYPTLYEDLQTVENI